MAIEQVTINNASTVNDQAGALIVRAAHFNKVAIEVEGWTAGTRDLTVKDATVTGDLTVTGATTLNGTLTLGDAAADALTVNATTTYTEPVNYSNATGISAGATQTQAGATALTEEINNVTTCATAGDGVKLKAAVAGAHQYVKNSGATALAIYPATSDSINALAINLAIRIQPGSSIDFYAQDATVWESKNDTSITIPAPTTLKGGLEIKSADSAGNTITTITNASQAAARIYTIPDAGADASFVQTEGTQTINGVKTFGDATDSTSKDTGGVITQGGVGIEKALFVGTTINAGTSMTVGTDITGAKEVDHIISVATTTTAATIGGKMTVKGGIGATSGKGGSAVINGGVGGATGDGGDIDIITGAGGGTSGNSGNITFKTENEDSTDTSGVIDISTGTTVSADSGQMNVFTGNVATVGNSGTVLVKSGNSTTTGNSGTVTLRSGSANTGDTGAVAIISGNATTGASGNVTITAGNGSTTSGSVIITAGNGGTDGTIDFKTNNTDQWLINASGALNPQIDNQKDIGNGTVNVRDVNIARGLKAWGDALVGTRGIANATCTTETFGDGKDFVTVITLTDFIVGDMGGAAAAKAFGNLIYTFPAGAHLYTITQFSVGFTGAGTANTPDVGLGSEIGSGVVATLNLSGTGAGLSEDYVTGQTANNITGTAEVIMVAPTAGLYTGIALNQAADVKLLHLNAASTWAADNAGNLTATGTIHLKWTKMS